MDFKRCKMDAEAMVFNAARDGNLHQLKVYLNGKLREEVTCLVSARTSGTTPLVMACFNGHLDVALYLIESCNADIEQPGLVTLGSRRVEDAPPLWCAAAAGHLNIVKLLIQYNASVNNTSERNITALRTACFKRQFEIAKYLIQHGADIEKANTDGRTCLMAACYVGHYEISKYLVECGADINRKCRKEHTALHACAESGSLGIIKLLLQSGARYVCSTNGSTPLYTAAINGHSQVVEYFIHEFGCTKQEKVNALELLGSNAIMEYSHMEKAFEFWKRAMDLRYEDVESPLEKPTTRSPITYYVDSTEVRTFHELEELVSDPDEMKIQALLIVERILDPGHLETFRYIIRSGQRYWNNGNFHKCLWLYMHALDVQLNVQEPINSWIMETLLCLVEQISCVVLVRSLSERDFPLFSFQDILQVFKISLRTIERDLYVPTIKHTISYRNKFHKAIISALHLVGLMCMLQPHPNIEENTKLKKSAYELVRLKPKGRNGFTLLHLACCRKSSFLFDDRFPLIKFPSPEVVDLLLEVGARPNAIDEANNTPLHIAAMNMPCAPAVFKALVNHGAHLDLCNYERKTPLQIAEIMPFLDAYPKHYINLQCLSAKAIRKHEIAYEGFVHENLKQFLDSH